MKSFLKECDIIKIGLYNKRKVIQMNKDNKAIKRILSIIGLIVFLAVAAKIYFELKWYDLLIGILKLQDKKKRIALVSKKTLMFITKDSKPEEALIEVMAKNGWRYVDQFGMGYVFSSGEEELLLKRRNFNFGYVVFEIYPREEYRSKFVD